ncbi:hypothetical protein ABFS82_01G068100 [Erythranthe guttata]|uniref:Late embryogenesis abundant protein LEA-2 subgroup domain-containing protein n=1 Tax=Erythranthe guttata TaxID=4155 RepID=A0A022Q715_ERYGU|nr:PREDICTED: uncharacterized protein LOC105973645 [Erythranthe guttata]EYU23414.1 hypothetical protein MIMGU_mgv1a020543mg [Erythranthe guttata]|eukprot:XP_012854132.1 PREDICTED: uncharacterized protein LOC105973645 [Erythranthe guttata]
MEEESHRIINPYIKSDEEEFTTTTKNNRRGKGGGSSKCLVYILVAVVLQSVAFLVFGLVALRISNPSLRLSSAAVAVLRHDSASLNMTVVAGIRLRNPNFGDFEFNGGSASLLYGEATVGVASIYGGRVGRRDKKEINVTMEVIGGGGGGELVKLRSMAELRGEVRVVKIVKRRRIAFMNCTMDLNLTSQAFQDLSCQ